MPYVTGIDPQGNQTTYTSYEVAVQNGAKNISGGPSGVPIQQQMQAANTAQHAAQFAPLPQLNGAGQASYAPPPPAQDPITTFNLKLMEMLGTAQQANSGNPDLAAQANKLQIGQTEDSMAVADPNAAPLRPGDALNARENAGELYNPEVKALNERMRLNNEAVSRFEGTLKAAQGWGEEYEKLIKPDDNTVQAVQMQMRAGIKPTAEVLAKMGNKLTQADFDALAAASKGGSDLPAIAKEFEYAKANGWKGKGPESDWFTQYSNEDANRKAVRSSTNVYVAGDPVASKNETRVKGIISANPRTAADYQYDLAAWAKAAAQINDEFNDPNAATKYDGLLKAAYGKSF